MAKGSTRPADARHMSGQDLTRAAKQAVDAFDEAYFVGGSKSNYSDYADVEVAIDTGFMPVVRRYAAYAGAGKERKSYLDVGCAFGFYVERLAMLGWETVGIDISAYAIERGRARGIANLHVAPAQELPFPDDSFDFVTAIDVIEHLLPGDAAEAVAEARRVLKKGGVAFFATPNFLTNPHWNIYLPEFEDSDSTHINYQSMESLRHLFAEFARCDIYGHTPFPDQFHAFETSRAFDGWLFKAWPIRPLARRMAWRLLGSSVEYSSYLHAVAIK